MLSVGSVCTGIGGLDLGLERAGMRVAWQCEADEKCRAVLARHWPGVPCFHDLRQLGPGRSEWFEPELRRGTDPRPRQSDSSVDLLVGGFPCQDLSVAGRRAGLAGERSALFFDLARVASVVLAPGGWLVIENVDGLLSSNRGRDFAIVLATLAELGFHDLAWRVLNSRYFGVPQRRRRVFIVARRTTGRGAAEVLLEPKGGGGNHQEGGKEAPRVASTLVSGSSRPGVSAPGRRQDDEQNIVNALDRNAGGPDDNAAQAGHFVPAEVGTLRRSSSAIGLDTPERYPLVAPPLTAAGHDASEDGTGRQALVYPTLRTQARNNSNGGSHARELVSSEVDPDREGATPGLSGRLDDPLRPLACPAEPRPDGPREQQMGNAVTVSVAEWIGQRILSFEEGGLT